jgi:YfiH family protein
VAEKSTIMSDSTFDYWQDVPGVLAASLGVQTRTEQDRWLAAHHLFPSQISFGQQVHGTHISRVTELSLKVPQTDGLWTTQVNVPLAVVTADCLAVGWVLEGQAVGVVHAGWRGLLAGILSELSQLWQRQQYDPTQIQIFISPANLSCHYQVSTGFDQPFLTKYGPAARTWFDRRKQGTFFNMTACAIWQLCAAGIEPANITDSSICTFENTAWHSYRREKKLTQQNLNLVMLQGEHTLPK